MATILIVEVKDAKGDGWGEVSRYREDATYQSSRHEPPKNLSGAQMAKDDCGIFRGPNGYGRPARIVSKIVEDSVLSV